MDCSTPSFPVLHYLPEFAQNRVHSVSDTIQLSHPLSPPSPPAFNLSQYESFPKSRPFASGGQNIGALAAVLPMNIQGWFPLGLTGLSSLKSKGLSRKEIRKEIMEKAMVPHSSTLAWKIPWMEEPSRLQSMGSLKVRHDWVTSLSLFTFMHWRRKWQPTPVFLPGESQGCGSLVGCHLWGHTESDTTEVS